MVQRIALVVSLLIVIGSSVVHGMWTERWTQSLNWEEVAHQLQQLPTQIGEWSSIEVKSRGQGTVKGIYTLARKYTHRKTGKEVTVLVGCGRPGPVCIHTPDVCYAASGYQVEPPRKASVDLPDGGEAQFWVSTALKERANERSHLRIYWAWNAGERWRVEDNPRMAFSGVPRLYKVYLLTETSKEMATQGGDPCVDFAREFLPQLSKLL